MTEDRANGDTELGRRGAMKPRVSASPCLRVPSSPQFVAIGHFTHDVAEDGLILGGAAAYSSIAARGLGLRAGVVSAVGEDFLHYGRFDNISLALVETRRRKDSVFSHRISQKDSEEVFCGNLCQSVANSSHFAAVDGLTTTFANVYEDGVRRQIIRSVSAPIHPEHIPSEWLNAEIVYLCPVADEVDPSIVHMFPNSLIGVSPQGWMRQWDSSGRVSPRRWEDAANVLPHANVLVMSEEDISPFPDIVHEYVDMAEIMVLTRGERGSTLFHDGRITDFSAFPTRATDPTGAGDVFAVAFLIEFHRTRDLYKASAFANCTASFAVEKQGIEGIPNLDRICSRMMSHQLFSSTRNP